MKIKKYNFIYVSAAGILGLFAVYLPFEFSGPQGNSNRVEDFGNTRKKSIRSNADPSSRIYSRPRNYSNRDLWSQIDKEKQVYLNDFKAANGLGLGASIWLNSPLVRFWIDRLDSADPEQVRLAIQVFESAAEIDPRKRFNTNGEPVIGLSQLELDCFEIRSTIDLARYSVANSRNTLNHAFEASDLTIAHVNEVDRLMNHPRFLKDCNDKYILKDAQPIIKVFAQRLNADDEQTSLRAFQVLNMFTYGIFTTNNDTWWKETSLTNEHLVQ